MTAGPNLSNFLDLIDKDEADIGARVLSRVPTSPPPPRLLGRYDPKGHSITYGPSGVGKGVLSSWDIVQLVGAGHRPLIVDYESHPDEWTRRIHALGGVEIAEQCVIVTPLDREFWGAPTGALWDIAERLRLEVERSWRTILVVDSLGPACMGMNMNDAATPQRYTEALALIGLPTISIGQINRAGDLSAPYGSVYWKYYSRAMWSAERAPGQDDEEAQRLLLTDRKANNYARAERTLVAVSWSDDLPIAVEERPYALALADQVAAVLTTTAGLTVSQIVDELNAEVEEEPRKVKADSVRAALRRGSKGLVPRFQASGRGRAAQWANT